MSKKSNLQPGNVVRMVNCPEAENHAGETFIVRAGPQMVCGTLCVWLKGYAGAFSCECLEEVLS